jgi:hydrogenase/urease accessory protein HupE
MRLLLAVLAMLFSIGTARADELRPGYLELTQRDARHWSLIYKAPVLGGLATRARPLLPPVCALKQGPVRLEGAAIVALGELTCSQALSGSTIGLAGMERGFTDALVRIKPLGAPVQAERLTPDHPTAAIAMPEQARSVGWTYLIIGVEHILTGYDHLLFVIALVLLIGQWWRVAKAATAFTLAHSLTLVGSTLGLFGLPQAPVEALIALSIVFLAVEIIKADAANPRLTERIPWAVAFLFGLLHGFGFAGALREVGLPTGDVPLALLTFNLGVEGGQLLIIAATLAVLALLRSFAQPALRPAIQVATYAIGTIASFWLIVRIVG